jgi:hypothetical protein
LFIIMMSLAGCRVPHPSRLWRRVGCIPPTSRLQFLLSFPKGICVCRCRCSHSGCNSCCHSRRESAFVVVVVLTSIEPNASASCFLGFLYRKPSSAPNAIRRPATHPRRRRPQCELPSFWFVRSQYRNNPRRSRWYPVLFLGFALVQCQCLKLKISN